MASKTLRDLETLLADREAQLVVMQADVEALRRTIAIVRTEEGGGDETSTQATTKPQAPAKTLRNEIEAILSENGEPMYYGDILDALVARGIAVPGRDPKKNVSAHMSNDDRFQKKGSGNWGLRRWESLGKDTQTSRDLRNTIVHSGWGQTQSSRYGSPDEPDTKDERSNANGESNDWDGSPDDRFGSSYGGRFASRSGSYGTTYSEEDESSVPF